MTQAAHTNTRRSDAGPAAVASTPVVPHVLYLAHDLDDAAIWRRVDMLERAGAQVEVAGFRRGAVPLPARAMVLGRTRDARLLQRVLTVGTAAWGLARSLQGLSKPDVILARNLEMLALAARACQLWPGPPVRVVYEVLDIHRMMLNRAAAGRVLRQIERRLGGNASLVLVSSLGFVRNYFQPNGLFEGRLRLVENKFVEVPGRRTPDTDASASPLTIGWFGILRCRWSLRTLDELTRADPGRYRVLLRGRPALDQMPDFHAVVEGNPDLDYGGPYRYPDDLAQIYGAVRLVWLADRFDAGANSDWLLPNRLYEGGAHGRIPIALEGTEVASFLRAKGIGLVLPRPDAAAANEVLRLLTEDSLLRLQAAMRAVPFNTWMTTADDCRSLLNDVLGRAAAAQSDRRLAEVAT